MKKDYILGIFFLVLSAGLLTTCSKEYIQQSTVCFENDIKPIINNNCAGSGCHDAITKEKGRNYTTLEGILKDVKKGNYQQSKLYQVLILPDFTEQAMPPKPSVRLADDQIELIARWIEEGATNTSCTVSTSCDTNRIMSYNSDIKPLINTNCAGSACHSATTQAGSISYATYASSLPTINNGKFMGSINHLSGFSAMPKSANKLSNCNIAKIQKWVNAGAPNN